MIACYDANGRIGDRKQGEMDTGPTFGDLLRRHRDSANLTQEELAARSGLTPQAIGLLERGERRRPHSYTVGKLAEALALKGQMIQPGKTRASCPHARRRA